MIFKCGYKFGIYKDVVLERQKVHHYKMLTKKKRANVCTITCPFWQPTAHYLDYFSQPLSRTTGFFCRYIWLKFRTQHISCTCYKEHFHSRFLFKKSSFNKMFLKKNVVNKIENILLVETLKVEAIGWKRKWWKVKYCWMILRWKFQEAEMKIT